jgi:drug/metabolite transporter (DMT)-like permease
MVPALALTAAAAYGVADFLGGVAARRAAVTAVVLWSHVVGLATMLLVAPLVGGRISVQGLMVGAAAGLIGAIGVTIFYRALALGAMSVVAPITALLSAAVPVLAGIGNGERPEAAAMGGIGVALVAITLVSREPGNGAGSRRRSALQVKILALALASGLAFGLFFVALDGVGDGAGLWPLVGARLASVGLFVGLGVAGMTATGPPRGAAAPAIGCGVLDSLANAFYLIALSYGLLSVVAVLTALYPAGTVILARWVLGERTSRVQQGGLALAAAAALLIASA